MKTINPFDRKVAANQHLPESTLAAMVDVTDTLDFMWASAQAVFGKAAKPEHAIALLPLALAALDEKRQLREGEFRKRTRAAAKQGQAARTSSTRQ